MAQENVEGEDELVVEPIIEGEIIEEDAAVSLVSEASSDQDQQASVYAVFFLKKLVRLRGVRISRDDFLRQELRKLTWVMLRLSVLLQVILSLQGFRASLWTSWPMMRFLSKRRNLPRSRLLQGFQVALRCSEPFPPTSLSTTFTRYASCKSLRTSTGGESS